MGPDFAERHVAHDLASFARMLTKAARLETLPRFARGCAVEDKSASGPYDPVTEADRAAEGAMRELIERSFPDHGIQGEEFGHRAAAGRCSWSLDPIDGTRSFVCGLPTWVTLVALLEDGDPVLGLIDVPSMDELYIGTKESAWVERSGSNSPIQSSTCTTLGEARLSTTDPYLFVGIAAGAFDRLRSQVRLVRLGYDGYAYARLAAGTLDLVVECSLKPHDYNALIPLVRGAGGVFGDWAGGTDFGSGNVIAAATPELYESAVAVMRTAAEAE